MSYIAPNSTIKIFNNVPLDQDYVHTIYFNSLSEQLEYFSNALLIKHTLSAQSYVRTEGNVCKVQINADLLYDCDYMAFQNTAFGSKWFYAFITEVEYINNVTSQITFEIDELQTWWFDMTIKECFVEREHSLTDNIGDNITPESIETGEYIFSDYADLDIAIKDMCVMVSLVDVTGGYSSVGKLYDGIFSGNILIAFSTSDIEHLTNLVSEYVEAPDTITSMYMIPSFIVGGDPPTGGKILSYGFSGNTITKQLDAIEVGDGFDGYVPLNNKLYTYPFNFLSVDNGSGSALNLRYEFFDDLTPIIEINGCVTQPIKVIAKPCSYKGVSPYSSLGGYTTLNTEYVTLESYPMCSWNVDAYKAWLAQNSMPIIMNLTGGLITSAATGGVGATVGLASVVNTLSSMYTASIKADICKGNVNNGNINCANGEQKFNKGRCHVTNQQAQIIDNFFNMYGYQTNRVKVPNIGTRPTWNYIKTNGCNIVGGLPAHSVKKISSIFDKGVTFWRMGVFVGNYSYDNKPI